MRGDHSVERVTREAQVECAGEHSFEIIVIDRHPVIFLEAIENQPPRFTEPANFKEHLEFKQNKGGGPQFAAAEH